VKGTPIQPPGAKNVKGSIEVFPEFCEGLLDLDGFSHIILLYHFHKVKESKLTVKPYMDKSSRGVFSTRIPGRPNPIGLSIVKLLEIKDCTVSIEEVDILDGTPLLDIKPYVPEFDQREATRIGWLSDKAKNVLNKRSDGRTA
jgi:tRNA-Thr(GGU) m(6)t(6)A37 methyltransferase TsaA